MCIIYRKLWSYGQCGLINKTVYFMSSDRPIVYYNYKQKCFLKDINKAIAYLTQSAEQKNEWADYQLGRLYLLGKAVPKNTEKAVAYLTKSAEQGNQFAQYILGKLYLLGKGIPKNKELAIKWLTLSAEW